MKKKLNHLELPRISHTKPKWKEICDKCGESKYDVHSYYDEKLIPYILCPECADALKNKLVYDWKTIGGKANGQTISTDKNYDKHEGIKEVIQERKKSKSHKNSSNIKNVSEDKGQFLHSGISGREKSTEHNIGRGTEHRKTKLI